VAESTTQYAVLGLVTREPTHGYALAEQIRRWPPDARFVPSVSAIYKALRRLSEAGWIEPLEIAAAREADRPGRTTYAATAEGEARYEEWLRRPPRTYEDLCVRVAAARRQDVPVLLQHAERAELACRDQLHGVRLPAVDALVARDASWDVVRGVLVGRIASAEVTARAKILHDLVQSLRALQDADPVAGVS
jgi:DNA-binding PadR family transcriptional regulator